MCVLLKKKWDTKQQRILTPAPSVHLEINHTQTVNPDTDDKNHLEYIRPMLSDNLCVDPPVMDEKKVDQRISPSSPSVQLESNCIITIS